MLKEAGLVVTERQGTKVVYSLNTSTAEDALAAVLELLGKDGTHGTNGAPPARSKRKDPRP